MDGDRLDSNVMDLLIKYGAAFSVLAYGLGFIEQESLFEKLGSRAEASLLNPRYFLIGAILMCFSLGFGVGGVLGFTRGHPSFKGQPDWKVSAGCSAMTLVFALFVSLVKYHAWVREALWFGFAAGAACAIVSWNLMRLESTDRRSLLRQVEAVFWLMLAFFLLAATAGRVEARGVLVRATVEQTQLLVAADAVAGAQQMGLSFPSWKLGQGTAQLSEKVDLVYEGDRTYVLRFGGQLVHLSKEKVLGTVP